MRREHPNGTLPYHDAWPLVQWERRRSDDRATVFIVERDDALRRLIRRTLDTTYRILEAASGRPALERMSDRAPDLVISGTTLPDVESSELCMLLRSDETLADVPIVLVVSSRHRAAGVRGMLAGADAFIAAPFEPALLWAQVGNLIARRHTPRKAQSAEIHPTEIRPSTFARSAQGIIEAHLSDPDFSARKLAEEMAASPSQLYRRLRKETGAAPTELIRRFRMERGAELLRDGQRSVAEVAYAVGYNSGSYFGRCFRGHFEQAPSEYAAQRG